MDQILKRLEAIEKQLVEQKKYTEDVIIHNTAYLTQISNNIDVKLDILTNLEQKSESKPAAKKSKAVAKSAYFKNLFKENIQQFIGELYTEEEIEEIYNNDEVKSKKTDIQKKNKAIDILYSNLNKNSEKLAIMKNKYEEYKKSIGDDEATVE